jgi:hypothetical protein
MEQHKKVQCLAYADDIILISSDIKKIQQASDHLHELLKELETPVNYKKCEYMAINNNQP